MRTISNNTTAKRRSLIRQSGSTLVEMMMTVFVFSMVIVALIYTHIFGLKQDQLVESKLGASDHARKGFGVMAREIRSAAAHAVGNYSGGNFTAIAPGVAQTGNALQVCLGTNTAAYTTIVYYFDTSQPKNYQLIRIRDNGTPKVIASSLTNSLTFAAEEYSGITTTNNSDRKVIHFALDFLQYQYPLTKVGSGSNYLYDRYKMDFRVTPHVPQGR